MCGIAGAWHPQTGDLLSRVRAMGATLVHRGPDDNGDWHDSDAGYAAAHRRLSIIDLSPTGHQPMVSTDGRHVLTFNGEIYNFRELREQLRAGGACFRGTSDTEVLLVAMASWGIERTLKRARGMFALALWDTHTRRLTLARDRMGEKPLYYGWLANGALVYASELRAIRAFAAERPDISRRALAGFLTYGYINGPDSIYSGLYKLPPASWLTLSDWQRPSGFDPSRSPNHYWHATDAAQVMPKISDPAAATDQLASCLDRVVADQMVSDVPLGAFLSGGIDSSTVVALMQAHSPRPVKTFTIGFDTPGFNEAEHAAAVASHLGTDHHELYVTAREVQDCLPDMARIFDEPHANPSQIPVYLVSRMAREQVTVSLSGDGGDELFAGYNRYHQAERYWRRLSTLPHWLRRLAGSAADALTATQWDALLRSMAGNRAEQNLGTKAVKLGRLARQNSSTEVYRSLIACNLAGSALVAGTPVAPPDPLDAELPDGETGFVARAMLWDQLSYLPEDNLAKVDRAAMATSLETRVPLLDPAVVELAWQLSPELRVRDGVGKWVLRQVLYRHVPAHLVERPKMGFSVPVRNWMTGPLRPRVEELLAPEALSHGLLDVDGVRMLWQRLLSGHAELELAMWAVVCFQTWHAEHYVSELILPTNGGHRGK